MEKNILKIKTNSIEDTGTLAKAFAENLPETGAFVSLFGDIGAGKTAFTRLVLENIGVDEKVTSPSFVILNEYKSAAPSASPRNFPIYHFDLYRLEKEGLATIKEELREYSKLGVLTFVEWADFGGDELPYNRLNITVRYDGVDFNDTRFYEFEPIGAEYEEFVQRIKNAMEGTGLIA